MVQLAAEPLAVAAADTPLNNAQRKQKRDSLDRAQAPVEQRVRELGGTVLGTYQQAYNGVKVRIGADRARQLAQEPGVIGVRTLRSLQRDNTNGVPLIGAPQAWSAPGKLHGEGIKVAIIDSGIDYTHADFGGPGTEAAYEKAHATSAELADPALFGPRAPKIKGGIDLAGDSYQPDPAGPDYQPVPVPDSNPLDCQGHGTHVAGTTAGFGVTADGKTYTGGYDARTISGRSWTVGPGAAPKADLYAVRVFGCEGSTDLVVDAIEWSVANDIDVINMSLGAGFGVSDTPEAEAADNAAKAGVIVVASSGNSGPSPYITGSPASSTRAISVAASDPVAALPGARLALGAGNELEAVVLNGAAFTSGTSLPVKVVGNGAGGIGLGCSTAEFQQAGVEGVIAVVSRGVCARTAKAVYGQEAGAAAVVQVNTTADFPPYEGPITENADTNEPVTVTIPFLGVPSTAAGALQAADGSRATLTAEQLTNPGYLGTASFSSAGARVGDSWLKPDVTAPGVSISSALSGSGNGALYASGTSMSSPHTAGAAALVRQAHPDWRKVEYWKAALVNTADAAKVQGYLTRSNGAGLVQVQAAAATRAVALGDPGTATLNYGFAELDKNYTQRKTVRVKNFGPVPATFTVSATRPAGRKHQVALNKRKVTVPPRGEAKVDVTLRVPAPTAGDSAEFRDVSGLVTFTPVGGANAGVALRVPYYFVPQAVSKVSTKVDIGALKRTGRTSATVTNRGGVAGGRADWYAWGLSDPKEGTAGAVDLKAAGVQARPADNSIAFAVQTHARLSNAAAYEFDVLIDVNADKKDDYVVVSADFGLATAGVPSGQAATLVVDLRSGAASVESFTEVSTDSSTLVLPVRIAQLCQDGSPCLSTSDPKLTYHVESIDITSSAAVPDETAGVATFNAFAPALSTGMVTTVAPGATARTTVILNRGEFARTETLGWMVVSPDNRSSTEAQLIRIG
ncbi:S8 family serine peptidase [Actinoplanes sp. TRM 88003]|uniref:S8 family serine peptidase n=2 Tax=Paractinoplanes aksuensis TaxID=2939490 RepID=A0ABT1DX36_9ACTN|nr:S8 family serine peptidase [Actinoplanes aksuensis]